MKRFSTIFLLLFAGCHSDRSSQTSEIIMPQTVYTKAEPGNWEGLEDEHLPEIIVAHNNKPNIFVIARLKDPSPSHYIEKIIITDKDGNEIAVKTFPRTARIFEAQFDIRPVPDTSHFVLVKCNTHDLWKAPFIPSR